MSPLSTHPVFADVDVTVRARLEQDGLHQRPPDGATVLEEGDPEPAFFALLAGSVKVLYRSEEGVELVVKLLEAPAVFGEMECIADIPFLETVVAVERVELLRVPKASLLWALERSHPLCARMLTDVAQRLCIAAQNERALAFHPVESRLAQLLLTYVDLYGLPVEGGQRIRIPLTQDGLAQALGVNRRSVTRALTKWTGEGWLDKRDGRYVVRDAAALLRITDPQLLRIAFSSGAPLRPKS